MGERDLDLNDLHASTCLGTSLGHRMKTAIPAEPSSPMITVLAALAFRKHRCENTPLT
jgi:hypothetical protein